MAFRVGWIDDPELGVRVLVLRDVGLAETLELQRGYERLANDQGSDGGTYCLVRNAAAVIYGGVESFDLSSSTLTLTLTSEAAGVLALPRVVPYDLYPDGLALVKQRLHEILA